MALTASDAAHFLRRVGFGVTKAEVTHFAGREIDDVVDEVLNIAPSLPAQPAGVTAGEWWECRVATGDWWFDRMAAARWVDRGSATPSPLVEKLTLFWHSHFAAGTYKVKDFRAMWRLLSIFWSSGLGDFEVLARRVALDGAMLVYLDNNTNVVGDEQENFARELMELHTIGVGNFSEADVIAMARAWTGHGVIGRQGDFNSPFITTYRYTAADHDNGAKTLFGITRNWDGPATITELVKGVKQEPTARFLARKLWRYFVDDSPDDAVVAEVADAMIAADMRVKGALRAILVHPRFWAESARFAVVRQPVEWATDVLRRFAIPAAQSQIAWTQVVMGQELFNPPNVDGWGTHEYWVSTTAVWGKARFVRSLREHPSVAAAFAGIENQSRQAAVDRILDRFGITEPSAATVTRMREWFDDIVAEDAWATDRDALYMGALAPEFQAG